MVSGTSWKPFQLLLQHTIIDFATSYSLPANYKADSQIPDRTLQIQGKVVAINDADEQSARELAMSLDVDLTTAASTVMRCKQKRSNSYVHVYFRERLYAIRCCASILRSRGLEHLDQAEAELLQDPKLIEEIIDSIRQRCTIGSTSVRQHCSFDVLRLWALQVAYI